MIKRVILGSEFDQELRKQVMDVLQDLGASATSGDWAVGGSQEIETLVVDLRGHAMTVEVETYVGLSATGEEPIIDEILRRLRQPRG